MNRSEAEDFLYREARLLNSGENREWQKLFTEDAIYWVPANDPNADPELHVSYIYDDMELLNERLGRLESDYCFAQQPPSSTLHQISNVEVEANGSADEVTLRSNALIYEYRNNTQQRFYKKDAVSSKDCTFIDLLFIEYKVFPENRKSCT